MATMSTLRNGSEVLFFFTEAAIGSPGISGPMPAARSDRGDGAGGILATR
jgi:hypothetical protein